MLGNFRLWDKNENKFFKPTYKAYAGELEEVNLSMTGRLGMRTMGGYEDESCFEGRFIKNFSTGFSDKNNVEIFIGDIVKHLNRKYEVIHFSTGAYLGRTKNIGELDITISWTFPDCEVIGNIFENKELLERVPND